MKGIITTCIAKDDELFKDDLVLYKDEIVRLQRVEQTKIGLFIEFKTPYGTTYMANAGKLRVVIVKSEVTDTEFRVANNQVEEVVKLNLEEINFDLCNTDNGFMTAVIDLPQNLTKTIEEIHYTEAEVYDHMLSAFNLALGLNQSQINKLLSTKKPIETLIEYWNKNKK